MKIRILIYFLMTALVAGTPLAFAGIDPALEEASRMTGVPLAENRDVRTQVDFTKKDGSQNAFLESVKAHQLELTELMALKVILGRELKREEEKGKDDLPSRERAVLLISKMVALQAQSMRYKEALGMSVEYVKSGFKPRMGDPSDWDGRMCNAAKQCTQVEPITALFILAQEARNETSGSGFSLRP